MRALRLLGVLGTLLALGGCGTPGQPPTAPVANPTTDLASKDLLLAAEREGQTVGWRDGASYRVAASGDWRVIFFDPPLRTFRLSSPPGVTSRVYPPTHVQFFSEGRRHVVVRPEGAPRMAFSFQVPDGMRPVRAKDPKDTPLHFPDADVWVFDAGQVLTLEWDTHRTPGWLGVAPCYDSTGARVPVSGTLHLPEGWVGVPTGSPIFKVGIDRSYGPYAQIQAGLWTSTNDPYPLAVELLDALRGTVQERLGAAPRTVQHVVIDSCGECRIEEGQTAITPRGETDAVVSWIRLGAPGTLFGKPGPLHTETIQNWVPVEDGDPTGLSLVNMYARALFPTQATLVGFSFLPTPSFSKDLETLIRTWRRRSLDWEAQALTRDLLPGILFECREADSQGFDATVRRLIARRRAPRWDELVQELGRKAPACLAPLRVRKLVD